jgi:CheY-like chemotaxis protein
VLVVDDDPQARELMQRFLQKEGFPVVTASSGLEALKLARQRRPIAVTLDVMMPGMDGWAVLQELKNDSATSNIPVVMISMVNNAEMGYALGVTDYMTKPPDRKRLGEILQRCASKQSASEVLIVDDDPNNRHMLASLALKLGCTIREAQNGREAIACIAERTPDLMLLDLMMPEMDGFEVVSELRRQGLTSQIPIIVLTNKDLTQEDKTRLEGHVENIRSKAGISRQELLREIKGYLELHCGDEPGAES